MNIRILSTILLLAYEGEEAAAAKAAADAAATEAAAEAAKGKKFSQDDVNKFVADEKRKLKIAQDKLVAELEAVRSKATLGAQDKEELEARIEAIKSESMTKEELLKQEKDRGEKKLKADLDAKAKEADTWKTRFTQATITRSITDAAIANDAFSPKQIVAQLVTNTRLVEELDESNKPTGEYVAKVKITETDKDGKPVTLDLPVTEAVKKLSENTDFANLFKGKGTGGTGGQNRGGGKASSLAELAKGDPAAYRAARASGKVQL